ncbi:MAG: hypothetical protein CVT99_16085 [Bacteroidetes bacterium HGW-Bacteroidetes-16]|jgi:hypothetical protein|nr:MAG: hypothetical protein CVT99_16085 [Bacteroidetes bacterium HGW-Bacteroidetes-16]
MKMKKSNLTKVFLLIVLGLTIVSCSKKDDTTNPTNGEIAGVWNCTAVNYTGTTVTEYLGQSITTDFTGEGYNVDFTFTINENPNVATSNGSYSIKLSSTTMGQTITQNIEDIDFNFTGEWSKDGNTMTVTQGGKSSDANIVKLTDTELEFKIANVETIENSGMTATSTTNTTISFTK